MTADPDTRSSAGRPFSPGERRMFRYGTTWVAAAHCCTQRHPTHEARRYHMEAEGLRPLHVQLNGGQPAEDPVRLERIVGDVLAARSVREESR